MKRIVIVLAVLGVFAILIFSGVSCTRIEAGHVGIKVDVYSSSDDGGQDIEKVQGMVIYNPITTVVYEFPTFVQHKVWTKDVSEDSPSEEDFTVTTRDGLSLSFDVGLDYLVLPDKVINIFRTYRTDLRTITNSFIRTMVRNAYNNVASSYSAEDMVSKRSEYETQVRQQLTKDMEKSGFQVSQLGIIGKIRLPGTLEEAVNAKIRAVQDAIRAENEKQRIIAEAQKEIEHAKGMAEALRIRSEAEANANKLINASLSPSVLQKMYIEKWDGKLPVYGQTPTLFKNLPGN